jgi:hypothetical protein
MHRRRLAGGLAARRTPGRSRRPDREPGQARAARQVLGLVLHDELPLDDGPDIGDVDIALVVRTALFGAG